VSRIEIFGPTLRVVRTAPDRWNVPPLHSGGTWVHPLPTLVVHAGRFAGRDPWRTWAVELRSVRMDGAPVAMLGGTGYRFSTHIEGTLRWRATTWTPIVLTAGVQIDPRMDAAFEANFRYDAPDGRGWTVYGVGRYHLLTGAWQVRMNGRFFWPPPASIERWATWEAYTGIPFRNLWTRRWTFHVSASDGPSIPVEVGLRPDGAAWQVRADCRVRSAESQCRVRLESPTGSPVQVEASVPGVGSRWPERWRRRPRLSGELALEGAGAAPFPTGGHARWEVAWPTATALWRHLGELTIPMPDRWLLRARLDRFDCSTVCLGWLLRYRYQDKDVREIPLDFRIHLRQLAVGLQWYTRDAAWFPGRGHFLSMDLEYAPAWLKSDMPYVKLFFQGQRGTPCAVSGS